MHWTFALGIALTPLFLLGVKHLAYAILKEVPEGRFKHLLLTRVGGE